MIVMFDAHFINNFQHNRFICAIIMQIPQNLDVIIKTGKNERKKENNSKNKTTMKLIHSSTSRKFALVYVYIFQSHLISF